MPGFKTGALFATICLVSIPTLAQGKADFSGKWTFKQAIGPARVSFPPEVLVKQTDRELHWQAREQEHVLRNVAATTIVFRSDGSEVAVRNVEGISIRGKVALDGPRLVITSQRTFSTPIGDVTADIREVYVLTANEMTVEKTQTMRGVTLTGKGVYTRVGR